MNEQLSLFEFCDNRYKITKPIRLIELFSGIGMQEFGIKEAFPNTITYKTCEWASDSIIAYNDIWQDNKQVAINLTKEELINFLYDKGISLDWNTPATREQIKRINENKLKMIYSSIILNHNLVNISKITGKDLEIVNVDQFDYIMTYSFPCQDLSLSGKRKGMKEDEETRSGLVWQVLRILRECANKPQILIMENVPQVHGSANFEEWKKILNELANLGYSNYWEDLNAKDYGIPQNRNRCFMISILGKYSYSFPHKISLEKHLKDLLESNVDKKYFISAKLIKCFTSMKDRGGFVSGLGFHLLTKESVYTHTISTCPRTRATDNFIGVNEKDYLNDSELNQVGILDIKGRDSQKRVYNPTGLSPTLTTCRRQQKIVVPEATKKGYALASENDGIYVNRCSAKRGVVQKEMIPTMKCGAKDIGVVVNDNGVLVVRSLTPLECCRLMGLPDYVEEKLRINLSESKRYHIYGDGLVVDVVKNIMQTFKES